MAPVVDPSETPPSGAPGVVPPHAQILDMTYTSLITHRAIYAAAKLGIPDLLASGARPSDDVARLTKTSPGALYRLLRALSSVGVLREHPGQRFGLTALGETLRSDAPGSMRGWVLLSGEAFYQQAWLEILHSIRTGGPAWEKVHRAPLFEYLAKHPEAASIFDEAMMSLSYWEARAVLSAYSFLGFNTVVDVGGGQGGLLTIILKAHPQLRGILCD